MLKSITDALLGTANARADHQRLLAAHPRISAAVEELTKTEGPHTEDDDCRPIFLLSAGWRSGSTLLQRLIMSDKRTMIWGEPYDECGMVQAMADSFRAFRPGWPPQEYYYDGTPPAELTGEWIANLFPGIPALRKAHRAFFDTLFDEPARRAGVERWGIKEVRWTAEHAAYLKWLYPKASFLFLYRDPLEAYRSYARYGRNWYDVFPDKPVFTPTAFGEHWRKLMEGFARDAEKLGAFMVRYEDLVSGKAPLDELERYLDLNIDHSLLVTKVGSSERGGKHEHINGLERWLLKRAVGPIASKFGYS